LICTDRSLWTAPSFFSLSSFVLSSARDETKGRRRKRKENSAKEKREERRRCTQRKRKVSRERKREGQRGGDQ